MMAMKPLTRYNIRRYSISVAAFCLITLMIQMAAFAQVGTLEWARITSPALENLIGDPTTRSFGIYLPADYQISGKDYPVIYVLHGYTGGAGSLTDMKPTLDSMIRRDQIKEMIVVFVDGHNKFRGSMYYSSITIGDYETYIARDLVKHIDANYRTIAHRNSRGITGYSMGGRGAMHLALKFPETFGAVVNQAGFCNVEDVAWMRNIAFANPNDWPHFNGLDWMTQAAFAYAAAACPNPDKPPFFLDKPYERVDGKIQTVPEVWERFVNSDVVHGDLPRYVKQPLRLNGIMVVHGTGDGITPVSQARDLDKLMTDLGIDHVYDEHGGGHDFIASKSLQFLSDHLSDQPPEPEDLEFDSTSVEPVGKLTTSWGSIKVSR
jgi:S-formylglutathione hydrolase FrmB